MHPNWETVLDGAGTLRAALVECAFRERILWANLCRLAGIASEHVVPLRTHIRRTYEPDGADRADPAAERLMRQIPAEIAVSVANFATAAIRDGAGSGIDRRRWIVGLPVGDDDHVYLTLEEASGLGRTALGRGPDVN